MLLFSKIYIIILTDYYNFIISKLYISKFSKALKNNNKIISITIWFYNFNIVSMHRNVIHII